MNMRFNFGFLTIQDTIELQLKGLEVSCDKAEILCLMGCMNLIEFIGGILNGKLGVRGCEQTRFKEGVLFLGGIYSNPKILGENRMWQMRCAVMHQYIPSISDTELIHIGKIAVISHPEKKPREILKNIQDPNRFLISIKLGDLVGALKEASSKLITKLKEDKDIRDTANRQFKKLPLLMDLSRFRRVNITDGT